MVHKIIFKEKEKTKEERDVGKGRGKNFLLTKWVHIHCSVDSALEKRVKIGWVIFLFPFLKWGT